MRVDLSNNIEVTDAILPQTVAGSNVASATLDLQGCSSATIIATLGAISEMDASPSGGQIDVHVEHADDDGTGVAGTFSDVADADVIGVSGISGGLVASDIFGSQSHKVGYRGGKRFIRVTLEPTGLSTGGPCAVSLVKGHLAHKPGA